MGTEFITSSTQLVSNQGIETIANAAIEFCGGCLIGKSDVGLTVKPEVSMSSNHLVSKNGIEEGAIAAFASASPKLEIFPYKQFGRPVFKTKYHVELRDSAERLKWSDDFENLVTSEGLDKLLDATFKTGIISPAWYIGLVSGDPVPAFVAADTMISHIGWAEFVDYSEKGRPAYVPGIIGGASVDNTSSRAVFNIDGVGIVAGCFMVDDDSIGVAEGLLYGEGSFSGGAREVEEGDILRVCATLTVAASEE